MLFVKKLGYASRNNYKNVSGMQMFRSRGVSKCNCVAADRSTEDFKPGGTLKPYPTGSAPKEYQEETREVVNRCAIL